MAVHTNRSANAAGIFDTKNVVSLRICLNWMIREFLGFLYFMQVFYLLAST